jgi:hypothetical protein
VVLEEYLVEQLHALVIVEDHVILATPATHLENRTPTDTVLFYDFAQRDSVDLTHLARPVVNLTRAPAGSLHPSSGVASRK